MLKNKDRNNTILELHKKSYKPKQIAEILGISINIVYQVIEKKVFVKPKRAIFNIALSTYPVNKFYKLVCQILNGDVECIKYLWEKEDNETDDKENKE